MNIMPVYLESKKLGYHYYAGLPELERKENHIIFPFILGWKPILVERAGVNFEGISQLKRKIVSRLKEKWILLGNYDRADYYKKFIHFKEE